MNFFKKSKKIAIIAPWELNLDVQDFALRYARAGTSIKVEMVSSLDKPGEGDVCVRFTAKKNREAIAGHFMEEFSERSPRIMNWFMFCH